VSEGDGERLHAALVEACDRCYGVLDGARLERRDGYELLSCPRLPVPEMNGVWVREDRADVAAALGPALAELEQTGSPLWLVTRTGQPLARAEARRLGYTAAIRTPGMALRAGELVEPPPAGELALAETDADFAAVLETLADGFGAPAALFEPFVAPEVRSLPGMQTYVVRDGGQVVSTAIGYVLDGTVGVFNVATPPGFRRRGFGAAVTAAAVRDGLAAGAELAWLQASPDGEPVYRRLGFRDVVAYALFTRP
jgi:ribosomal protein S18 acetylase RimI-like enzyme